jgi:hypothetical protein
VIRRILTYRESLDRLLDYTPAGDLPAWPDSLFTTSPSLETVPAAARGQHSAVASHDPLLLGAAAHVPGDQE